MYIKNFLYTFCFMVIKWNGLFYFCCFYVWKAEFHNFLLEKFFKMGFCLFVFLSKTEIRKNLANVFLSFCLKTEIRKNLPNVFLSFCLFVFLSFCLKTEIRKNLLKNLFNKFLQENLFTFTFYIFLF